MALVPQFQKFKASLTTNILWKWIAWSLDWWFDLHIWEFRCGLAFSLENDKCDSTSDGISNFQRPLKPHNFGNSTYSSSWLILKCLAASTDLLYPQNRPSKWKANLKHPGEESIRKRNWPSLLFPLSSFHFPKEAAISWAKNPSSSLFRMRTNNRHKSSKLLMPKLCVRLRLTADVGRGSVRGDDAPDVK